MTSATLQPARAVALEIIEAHGGLDRWREIHTLEVELSSWGLAFGMKGQPDALREVSALISTSGQNIRLTGSMPQPWAYLAPDGHVLAAGLRRLRTGGRRLRWDVKDVAAFAASALWTYFHVPFVLASPDVDLQLIGRDRFGERLQRLKVTFPRYIATHSAVQVLHFGEDRIIRQHDYTATSFGRWARASQRLGGHLEFGGLVVPTERTVTPRLPRGVPAPWPTLVRIQIKSVRTSSPRSSAT